MPSCTNHRNVRVFWKSNLQCGFASQKSNRLTRKLRRSGKIYEYEFGALLESAPAQRPTSDDRNNSSCSAVVALERPAEPRPTFDWLIGTFGATWTGTTLEVDFG